MIDAIIFWLAKTIAEVIVLLAAVGFFVVLVLALEWWRSRK